MLPAPAPRLESCARGRSFLQEAPPVPLVEEPPPLLSDAQSLGEELGEPALLLQAAPASIVVLFEREAAEEPHPVKRTLQRADSFLSLYPPNTDFLKLEGDYVLRPDLHNGAPCWEKLEEGLEDSCRVLFRAEDGTAWIIDEHLHDGDVDRLVAARLATQSGDPTTAAERWSPEEAQELRVRPSEAGAPRETCAVPDKS